MTPLNILLLLGSSGRRIGLSSREVRVIFFLLFIFFVLPIVICANRAGKINRNKIAWGILGLLLSYIAVLIVYLLSEPEAPNKIQKHTTLCPYCGEEIFTLARKCKHCNEWLDNASAKVRKKTIICPFCAEEIEKGLDICPICKESIVEKQDNY